MTNRRVTIRDSGACPALSAPHQPASAARRSAENAVGQGGRGGEAGEAGTYAWWGEILAHRRQGFRGEIRRQGQRRHRRPHRHVRQGRIGSADAGTIDALLIGGVELKVAARRQGALWAAGVGRHSGSGQARSGAFQGTGGLCDQQLSRPVYRNQTGFVYDPEKVPTTPPQTWAEFTAWLDANPHSSPSTTRQGRLRAGLRAGGDRQRPRRPGQICRRHRDEREGRRLGQGLGVVPRQ